MLRVFTLANGVLTDPPAEDQSADKFARFGASPSVSSNGDGNRIIWCVNSSPGQLRAYNADTLAEIYNSDTAGGGRDTLGAGVKFAVPTVANGRVYVTSGVGGPDDAVNVYGLFTLPTAPPAAPTALTARPGAGLRSY